MKTQKYDMILLVEDDAVIRESLAEFLSENYEVVVAADGKRATELYDEHCPRIKGVITDYEMPEMNGMEVVRWLREKNRKMPALLMTGKALSEDENNEITSLCGAKPISKPIDFNELLQIIERHFFGLERNL